MPTRWPRSRRPEPPLPSIAEIEAWLQRQAAAAAAGPAAQTAWADQFTAWCRERGVNPVRAVQAAARAHLRAVAGDE